MKLSNLQVTYYNIPIKVQRCTGSSLEAHRHQLHQTRQGERKQLPVSRCQSMLCGPVYQVAQPVMKRETKCEGQKTKVK
jgi:hypothetical protein